MMALIDMLVCKTEFIFRFSFLFGNNMFFNMLVLFKIWAKNGLSMMMTLCYCYMERVTT